MDYEQKYKEALGQAKQAIENIPDKSLANWLRNIFPELKESEDERMLQEIKRYIKEQGDKPTGLPNGTVAVSDMIAWLEQGEKSLSTEETELNSLAFLTELGYTCIPPKEEQQPEDWSEEDKEMLNNCIGLMQEIDCTQEEQNWLKSLKPNHWKPSEEQLNAFEHFVKGICESGYATPYNNNVKLLYSLLNDLKKL